MNILFVSSEALPFAKTGGLADVAYALPKELVKKGEDVSVVMPFYSSIDQSKFNIKFLVSFAVKMGWRCIKTDVYHSIIDGIDYYLIRNDFYFNRNNGLYGYYDDGERYAFFSNAVLELVKHLPFKVDVIHVNDWQTGMIPCLIKEKYKNDEFFKTIKTVLTIHNPLFKGYFGVGSLNDFYGLDQNLFFSGRIRLEGQVSTLKAGIAFADKITTVSPTHAYELKTPEGSKGLWYDLVLRQNDFVGILNGMDYKEFDPSRDPLIYANFTKKEIDEGKKKNKDAFVKEHNLKKDAPLFSVVSRLTDQKGLTLINAMADFAVSSGANFALVGSGEKWAEDYYNNLQRKYPENVMVFIGYNNEIAHKVYAASDFFLMPSAFEPCGLGQMIAQRYGTLPIVRRTGGLKDSVTPYSYAINNYKEADGFGFDDFSITESLKCVAQALMTYNSRYTTFKKLRLNAAKVDHTWSKSADEYIDLYKLMLNIK